MPYPLEKLDERYRNDNMFRTLVDMLQGLIMKLEMSPSEIREAAMYACYRQELMNPKPLRFEFDPRNARSFFAPGDPVGRRLDAEDAASATMRPNVGVYGGAAGSCSPPCLLCGGAVRSGQRFCGAACSQRWEAGERP